MIMFLWKVHFYHYILLQRAELHLKKQCQNSFDLGAEVSLLETDFAVLEQSVGVRVAECCSRLLEEAGEPPSLERQKTRLDTAH